MRLIVAGASGVVGRQLIPLLSKEADDLLVVGRDAEKLRRLFPNQNCIDYESLPAQGHSFDMMVCLVTLNNDQAGTLEQFREVNVDKVMELARIASRLKIRTFVHFSTFHVVSIDGERSDYAETKLEAENAIRQIQNIKVINLRLPAIYGEELGGKLKLLSVLPEVIRRRLLAWVGAIHPIVSVESVAEVITRIRSVSCCRVYLSDSLINSQRYDFLKRSADLFGALVLLVFLGWAFPLIWLAVKLDSTGPGIFAQERVGKNKVPFKCYKFRTMFEDTSQSATHTIPKSSVTRIGKWLRSTKLDELPQIFNVFQNTMSFVGPRPCLPLQSELVSLRERKNVFSVRPGITGLAQIRDIDMSQPGLLADTDSDYIYTKSMLLDLKIVISTLLGRGSGDRVAVRNSSD